ncbi:homeobox protein Hox-B4-like [Bactrocera dorsalis]|uniref:Homeobox protein Hox-B4-like n=1 Tax=Bactrocera dorsalis TaxID=27457 RepID=A0ABM3JMQ5_BACDO|nr:homeobox protein Hox-B4-like [Bactrocera dorsalis]
MIPNTTFPAFGQCCYENAPPNAYGRYNVYGNIQPTSIYGNPHIHQTSSQSPPTTPPLTDNGPYSPATTIATDNRNYSRTVYTREQVAELETEYRICKFATGPRRRQIAERIGVDELKIKVWFKNRRAKDKKRSAITPSNSEENRLSSEILDSSNNPNEEASPTSQNSLKRMSDDIDDLLQAFEDYIREKNELLQPPLKKPKVEILEHMIFNPTTNCWVRYDSLCPM